MKIKLFTIQNLLLLITYNMPKREIRRDDSTEYLTRYYIGQLFGITFYLHHFHGGDVDDAPHCHPWRWSCAIILAGWYNEFRIRALDSLTYFSGQKMRRMTPGKINLMNDRSIHQITDAVPDTWTLFFHGKRVKGWGFYKRLMTPEGDAVLFHQPLDIKKSITWWHTAKSRKQLEAA